MNLGNIFSLLSESGILNNTQQPSTGNQVVDLVESLLGGGQTTPAGSQQPQSAGEEVVNMLGSLLGGDQAPAAGSQPQAASPQNPSDVLLDTVLNVLQSPAAASQIQPIVNRVAAKIGIPPQTAMTVVTFVIHYLATNHGTRLASGEDMSSLLQDHADGNYAQANKLSAQLAKQTGLDKETAANALAETFKLLGVNGA